MKRNAMRRNLRQSIFKSFGRYIAIAMIIALGAGLFVGLLMTKADMVATGQQFIDRQNMFDFRMICNYGWTDEYLEKFSQLEGVEAAEGTVYLDLIAKTGNTEEDSVYRFYSMPENINKIELRSGRMPEKANECLADGYFNDESLIGQSVLISKTNDEDDMDAIRFRKFTIVGLVSSPLYMDMNRGTTSVGSGSLENYYYIPSRALDVDYYSEIYLTIPGEHAIYSDEYQDVLDAALDTLEPQAEAFAQNRYQKIKDEAEEEYADGYQDYIEGKEEAEQELADALQELEDGEEELADSRRKLNEAAYQIERGKAEIESGKQQLESAQKTYSSQLSQVKAVLSQAEAALSGFTPEMGELYEQAAATVATLKGQKSQLEYALSEIDSQRSALNAAASDLKDAYNELMVNWGRWHKAEEELADGWVEYEDAKKEVEEELAEAEAELADARKEIDDMEDYDLIVLDRTSNVGYNNLDSSSDIVSGVSRVFPVFFLLVASLVCITTMTRMIDEERTQIGTLKALGYNNREIMSKYMFYSGSGAIFGCSLGILAGLTIFPQIIWEAYKIMLYIQPDILLTINWPLVITVVAVYTAVMLFVTWYCCRKTLMEEPAELIRPKAPEAGKKIFMEYLPFWHRISFLNKVTIRNIFRYRQRLAMMLVGIGGCTALLVTGFGLRDSLVNVVDFQFQDVTTYDLEVYFRDEVTPETEREFLDVIGDSEHQFYHQSSVEVEYNHRVKEIYMISSFQYIHPFVDLHYGEKAIPMPQENEIVISIGVAEMLGFQAGDTLTIRNSDMESMEVTVSDIYENHVYNYCVIAPETIEANWGSLPELQMAFVRTAEGVDAHALSAAVTDMNEVMNVAVSSDLANMVKNMMKALDLVIILIVFCAGLLAVIVLYNLTNININERIREIATIKVLGFNAGETGAYVFKENLTLTVFGSVLGLFMGKLLLDFVMTQIKIDMVWFKTMITPESYLLSILLTIFSALVVDFIFYFRLQKINMAEALKSVE